MPNKKPIFYLTTAIDYPNGAPHIGHVYEKLISDSYVRWYRLLDYDVRFLTGTDENGQKLVKAAAEQKIPTLQFIDANVDKFRQLCKDLNITIDDFIRTTEERHIKVCHDLWRTLEAKDDIYFDHYSGHYCIACESFYLESQAENLRCPVHSTPLEFTEEDGYFFRMSRYQKWIIQHIKDHPHFIFPNSARKEILSRLENEELKDLSISRPNTGWGISVPGNDKHVIYTWFDALINYYSALDSKQLRERYWPASMHVIGKDITWFHSVIWPVMLHAAGLAIHDQVHVHGMVLGEDGKRMSKSLGNGVDPYDLIGKYPVDLLRYYLLRAIPSGGDGRFSLSDMVQRNNSELANDFGNLALRVIKLAEKRLGKTIDSSGVKADFDFVTLGEQVKTCMQEREHNRAVDAIWEGINRVNAYLNTHEPWRIKDDLGKFKQHIYNGLYGVYCFSILLQAFIPDAAAKTLRMLGSKEAKMKNLGFADTVFEIGETETLFPKLEL